MSFLAHFDEELLKLKTEVEIALGIVKPIVAEATAATVPLEGLPGPAGAAATIGAEGLQVLSAFLTQVEAFFSALQVTPHVPQ